jgi:glycosyltransferase involved in cell wall biosynthesis
VGDPLAPLFEELRAAPWFHHAGVVSDEELAAAYRSHDLLLDLEFNQPAFGLVVLEAMTAGCTPVVSARGALPEVVTPWNKAELVRHHALLPGYVLQAGDVDGLTELLGRWLAAGRVTLPLQRRLTREQASHFDFDTYMHDLERQLEAHSLRLALWQERRHRFENAALA